MQELDDFIMMVETDRFADAHVVLEHPWKLIRSASKDEGNILKGLINGATAFELKKRGKDEAALRIWSAFEKYRPLIETVDSAHLHQYRACAQVLQNRYEEIFGQF